MVLKFCRKIKNMLSDSDNKLNKSQFHEIGFHGDKYLIEMIDQIIPNVDIFVETGTNIATTACYVGRKYSEIDVYSCEPDIQSYERAKKNAGSLKNVNIENMRSPDFLGHLMNKGIINPQIKVMFFLDAHGGGYEWPLGDELKYISKNINNFCLIIDDAKVPGIPEFKFDKYENQQCDLTFLHNSFSKGEYKVFWPGYTLHTSNHHPLTGYAVVTKGNNFESSLSPDILRFFKHYDLYLE